MRSRIRETLLIFSGVLNEAPFVTRRGDRIQRTTNNMKLKYAFGVILLFGITAVPPIVDAYTFSKEQAARSFPEQIRSEQEAMRACKPGMKAAMFCEHCKDITIKDGKKAKDIRGWFVPGRKHDCSKCGGAVTMKLSHGTKSITGRAFTHACSKCGDDSAYVCATDLPKSKTPNR